MYVYYTITISCAGGLSAYVRSNTELFIRGVNSAACKGNFTLNYQFEIYQTGRNVFNAGYKRVTLGSGFNAYINLYSPSTTNLISVLTEIPSSSSTAFQSSLDCKYALSTTLIDLGTHERTQIYLRSVPSTGFTISVSGCNNDLSGGSGRSHDAFVYWTFDAVDPNDPTILANTLTGPNVSSNVGARISCNNGVDVAMDKTAVKLVNSISFATSTSLCQAVLVPTSNVRNVNEIQPGSFKSRATLTFQFN